MILIDGQPYHVLYARTAAEKARGLSHREALDEGTDGMLFLYPSDTYVPFTMKDTLIPLTIAYFDGAGRLLGKQDMEPGIFGPYWPQSKFRYALEFPQGTVDLSADSLLAFGDPAE